MIPLSQLVVRAWLIIWVSSASLFTVNLPNLPTLPDDGNRSISLQYTYHDHFSYLSKHLLDFENDNATFLEEDHKSKKRKVEQSSADGIYCLLPNRPLLSKSVNELRAIHPRILLIASSQSPRAPPSSISF